MRFTDIVQNASFNVDRATCEPSGMENERRRDPGGAQRDRRIRVTSRRRGTSLWRGRRTVAYPTENTQPHGSRATLPRLHLISATAHMYLSKVNPGLHERRRPRKWPGARWTPSKTHRVLSRFSFSDSPFVTNLAAVSPCSQR